MVWNLPQTLYAHREVLQVVRNGTKKDLEEYCAYFVDEQATLLRQTVWICTPFVAWWFIQTFFHWNLLAFGIFSPWNIVICVSGWLVGFYLGAIFRGWKLPRTLKKYRALRKKELGR